MAAAEKEVQIYPTRKDVDAARLAEALLRLVDHLTPKDKAFFLAEGERVLGEIKGGGKAKESAA